MRVVPITSDVFKSLRKVILGSEAGRDRINSLVLVIIS